MSSSGNSSAKSQEDDGKVHEYCFTGIRISSSRPSPPVLNPSCLEEEVADHALDASGARPPIRNKQLRVFLPRTPSSPSPSPFCGPWHRSSDSSSSSKSSTPSPASTKSSPATPPGSGIEQAFNDPKAVMPGPLSGSPTQEMESPRLTRRHSFPPKASVMQEDSKLNAANKSHKEIVIPDIERPFEEVPSSLEEAVTSQQPDMVAYYLRQGASPDDSANSKVSPLILAAAIGNEKIVRMLLAAGADINYEDRSKGTALHHAAAGGHRGVIKLLLVAGANMFHKTDDGQLAVQLTHDSRIRHLLTCRMRSSSESNIAQKFGSLETQFDSPTPDSATQCRSPTTRCSKVVIQNPVSVPPLPCSENGFVETTMQKVSPRSESPKNIQRVMEQRKERLRKGVQDRENLKEERESGLRTECSSRSNDSETGVRSRRRSVQFLDETAVPEKAKVQCQRCGKDNCSGQCQEQPQQQAAAAGAAVPETSPSSSQGVAEKLFPQPEAKTTGKFKWTKGELLGEGAYGKVFSGLNQSTGELMAVKQLKIDPGEGQEKSFYLAALEREINLYRKLRHKHIVGYINMEQDEQSGSLYIFLEYVSGGSIQSMLERFGRFSEPLVRVYTRQLLLGLQYLHENRIVHRDIKGGNVLVDAIGVVKLADFGASKAFHDPTVTNECKSIRGSVFWMAPEVIKGDGYGRRADIWSVGCTVIEMLTAMHPWPDIDNTWSAIFHIAKASSGPPIPEHGSGCVKDFLQQCFQMDPRLRPTATQLLEHRFVAGDPDEDPR
ncbi:serine/threonine-protein kinase ste20 isoform X1 [Selaginella moellendorffii]|uniref:serine/threonine-protein kinase ste20 isoform X1 n=2 Tax=Selaginella moellendorffii TaxID=88036 RepID=UPI000D1CC072|nr:serine/threonine-protein kinase ste20 isoform X1 [Selaginella moellendorffii]|eukprot:XP_024527603.1 serine/threonine-protein kinase ste20 isoform X1 [Selaginella moellendorffii]